MTTLTEFLLARIAEECEAKRRIVEALSPLVDYDRDTHIVMRGTENVATTTLHLLALPYAAHPDYDEEWKP